ncbi:uncharacterized protein [Primulina huaijiensis]|uniref:uncharacterized protein n=1 Tax=Primulina huaijiensis TaxID=1492673 RepID=UPI003CC75A95
MIDAVACGNLLRKTAEEGKIDSLNVNGTTMHLQEILCDKCGGEHYVKDGQDSDPFYVHEEAPVNQVGIQNCPRNDPYSNTYNPGWREHPNFSWGWQSSQNRPQVGQQYGKQPMYRPEPREEKSSLDQMMSKFILSTETRLQNQDASIKGLENQIGQLAKMITSRDPRTLLSNTETNPKEQVKAITLRSGKVLEKKEKEKEDQGEEAADTSIALKKAKLDAQFSKFLEVFKKLHINISFADSLMQIPSYAKFLIDILANKRKKLRLGKPKPTRMSLQLATGSVKFPRGVIEDVLVKVGKFIFPGDFVVLDMEEDRETPLILGRPFLATGNAVIDVQEGKSRLRVGVEEITFNDAMTDPLEATLTTEVKKDELDEEKSERVAYFNANHLWKKPERMKLDDLGHRRDLIPQKSSIEEPLTRELNLLPPHLKYVYLERTKLVLDMRITPREIKEGEPVLLYNSKLRLFPDKLKSRWTGPYMIIKPFPSRAIILRDGKNEPFTVNAQRLKH